MRKFFPGERISINEGVDDYIFIAEITLPSVSLVNGVFMEIPVPTHLLKHCVSGFPHQRSALEGVMQGVSVVRAEIRNGGPVEGSVAHALYFVCENSKFCLKDMSEFSQIVESLS